jgi:hypothetical protein
VVSQTEWFEMVSKCGRVDWFRSGMVRVWIGNGSTLDWVSSRLRRAWIGMIVGSTIGLDWFRLNH